MCVRMDTGKSYLLRDETSHCTMRHLQTTHKVHPDEQRVSTPLKGCKSLTQKRKIWRGFTNQSRDVCFTTLFYVRVEIGII